MLWVDQTSIGRLFHALGADTLDVMLTKLKFCAWDEQLFITCRCYMSTCLSTCLSIYKNQREMAVSHSDSGSVQVRRLLPLRCLSITTSRCWRLTTSSLRHWRRAVRTVYVRESCVLKQLGGWLTRRWLLMNELHSPSTLIHLVAASSLLLSLLCVRSSGMFNSLTLLLSESDVKSRMFSCSKMKMTDTKINYKNEFIW